MKIAIVGTSNLTPAEREGLDVRLGGVMFMLWGYYKCDFITGDADGVDSLVRKRPNVKKIESDGREWKFYKLRNIKIAEEADLVICYTTKTKTQKCYHCKEDHQRSGGCWTVKYAKSLGKKGTVIVI